MHVNCAIETGISGLAQRDNHDDDYYTRLIYVGGIRSALFEERFSATDDMVLQYISVQPQLNFEPTDV